ncbi:MAG: hydroxymethylbilane synthase [Syntrophus sp. (in: bacteria)]|nr:hydroxymethylbilane synthase [Syntrophus sp. (in: bacteria)]
MKKRWIIGTRGSKLALRQTHIVMEGLQRQYPDYEFIIKTIKTTGDTIWDKPLHLIGGKGLFVKEIEEQLLNKNIDMAVHSVKDLPAELEEGLRLGAVLKREDPRDAFISSTGKRLHEMTKGSRIGTGSLRRKAQLLNYNKALKIVPIRGNIDTRLRKLETEKMDGIVLASAGVKRMGLEKHITEILPLDIMIPSCGQGAIGIEIRAEEDAVKLLEALNDEKTFREVSVERTLLKMIGGGCHLPLGIHVSISGNTVLLYISMGAEDNRLSIHEQHTGHIEGIPLLISEVFHKLKKFLA